MKRREVERIEERVNKYQREVLMELENIVDEEMLTVEDVNEMLAHTDKGRTRQTIRNCVTVLQNDPVLKKAIRRNELYRKDRYCKRSTVGTKKQQPYGDGYR